eukprot:scpid86435/ scgid10422/ 
MGTSKGSAANEAGAVAPAEAAKAAAAAKAVEAGPLVVGRYKVRRPTILNGESTGGVYVTKESLGSGMQAHCDSAERLCDKVMVAVKMPRENAAGGDRCHQIELEVLQLSASNGGHPHLVKFFEQADYSREGRKAYGLVLELCDLTLARFTRRRNHAHIVNTEITRQIYAGLDFMHTTLHATHGDMQSVNILVSRAQGVIKLTDFGNSTQIDGKRAGELKRLDDLFYTARDVSAYLWLKRELQLTMESGRMHFAQQGFDLFDIKLAIDVIHPSIGARFVSERFWNNPAWFETYFADKPLLKGLVVDFFCMGKETHCGIPGLHLSAYSR